MPVGAEFFVWVVLKTFISCTVQNTLTYIVYQMAHDLRATHDGEEACAKLWGMYVQEAQRYDEGLVRSWKEDMDVTLVFSGLYSAILTAFIIESYQNLQEDPADISVTVLRQISSQISTLSGARNVTLEPPATFDPSSSALACNILWFASLSLALLCALLATFVQQWARKFLHRTTMGRSPLTQARLIQFLYFGLKDLGVHAIVDAIPSLLHLSIFLFFAGLLAFLVDVNIVLVYMIAVVLFVIVLLYILFTILPIITLRSFYRTPLSPIIWRLSRSLTLLIVLRRLWGVLSLKLKKLASDPEEPTGHEAVIPGAAHATKSGPQIRAPNLLGSLQNAMLTACRVPSHHHEIYSIIWTMKSINDDVELLQFVEAFIDALWGKNGLLVTNYHLIRPLLETNDPHLNIILRVSSLLDNAENPWFNDNHRKRCRIVFPKFFWILGSILIRDSNAFTLPELFVTGAQSILWFDFGILTHLRQLSGNEDSLVRYYASSAVVICALSMCESIQYALSARETITNSQVAPFFWTFTHDHNPASALVDAHEYEDIRLQLQVRSADAVHQYLDNATVYFPYEFDQTAACFWECRVKLYLDGSVLKRMTNQLEWYSERNQHEPPKDIPSLSQLDRILCVVASLVPDHHIYSVVQYIAKRVDIGGWKTTREIWWEERFLARFYDLINGTDPAEWDEIYFVAFNEAIACDATAQATRGPWFWDTLLQRYRDHITERNSQVSPSAASLQYHIMHHFLRQSNANTLLSRHLLAYTAKHVQLYKFSQAYIEKDAQELYSVLLMLVIADPNLKRSPALLRDLLSFYLVVFSRRSICYNKELFAFRGVMKDLSEHTKALADEWITNPSVEWLEIIHLAWLIWESLLLTPKLSSKPRSEFTTLFDAGQLVLGPGSRSKIIEIREQEGGSYKRWLGDVLSSPELDVEETIEGVLARLVNASEEQNVQDFSIH